MDGNRLKTVFVDVHFFNYFAVMLGFSGYVTPGRSNHAGLVEGERPDKGQTLAL